MRGTNRREPLVLRLLSPRTRKVLARRHGVASTPLMVGDLQCATGVRRIFGPFRPPVRAVPTAIPSTTSTTIQSDAD
jgi:hypothetical protein